MYSSNNKSVHKIKLNVWITSKRHGSENNMKLGATRIIGPWVWKRVYLRRTRVKNGSSSVQLIPAEKPCGAAGSFRFDLWPRTVWSAQRKFQLNHKVGSGFTHVFINGESTYVYVVIPCTRIPFCPNGWFARFVHCCVHVFMFLQMING